MDIDPNTLSDKEQYRLMTGTVVPHPIALVTTVGPHGVNAAPFSLFNIVGTDPPMIYFAAGDLADGLQKNTIQNLKWKPEFVVNIVDEAIAARMNICATDFAPGVDELLEAGLGRSRSAKVEPPRIAESPAQFECRVMHLLDVGARHHMVIGEVLWFHYRDGLVNERYHVDFKKLNPIGRLSGSLYARLSETFELERPYLAAGGR